MSQTIKSTLLIGVVVLLAVIGFVRLTPMAAVAAPDRQGIGQLPLELYVLLNQPGPLWLAGIDLEGVDLAGANLTGANLRQARLNRVNLSDTNLVKVDFRQASLVGANLSGSALQGANLIGAALQNADLRGADLTLADLSDANLTGARYDITTIWPTGYDPVVNKAREIAVTPAAEGGTPTTMPEEPTVTPVP